MTDCEHHNFQTDVKIARMSSKEDGPITGFMAEVRIMCTDCNRPFQFLGLNTGLDTQGATVSLDGLEANIAICPAGARPAPIHRMGFTIKPRAVG